MPQLQYFNFTVGLRAPPATVPNATPIATTGATSDWALTKEFPDELAPILARVHAADDFEELAT